MNSCQDFSEYRNIQSLFNWKHWILPSDLGFNCRARLLSKEVDKFQRTIVGVVAKVGDCGGAIVISEVSGSSSNSTFRTRQNISSGRQAVEWLHSHACWLGVFMAQRDSHQKDFRYRCTWRDTWDDFEMFTAWSKINWICNVYWMTNMLWVSHLSPCRHGIWQKDVGELGSRHGGFQCTAIWRVPAWSTLPEIQHPNLQLLCLVPMTLFPNCQCVLGIGFWDDGAGVESVWYWGQEWHWI